VRTGGRAPDAEASAGRTLGSLRSKRFAWLAAPERIGVATGWLHVAAAQQNRQPDERIDERQDQANTYNGADDLESRHATSLLKTYHSPRANPKRTPARAHNGQ
jgi:hypothetical protein